MRIFSFFTEKHTTTSSMLPSTRRIQPGTFVAFLCIAMFLDNIECFTSERPIFSIRNERLTNSLLLSSVVDDSQADARDVEAGTTITLPSFSGKGEKSALHHIHIRPLLTDDQADTALELAINHAEANDSFDDPNADRHASYATCDFPVDECEELRSFFESILFEQRVFDQFAELYNVDADDLSFQDLFIAYYQAKPDGDVFADSNIMDRLELHRDGSLFSFSLLLNAPDEFEGGGTFYDALRDVDPDGILHTGGAIRPERAGDAVLHCGKILHGADVVTLGRRVVLVGFVDVSGRNIRNGILGNACKEWGRQDVAEHRYRRQKKQNNKGWTINNSRWLSKNNCAIQGFVPASNGVIRRGGQEGCRRRRLETEDDLLQSILLPPDERGPKDFQELSFDAFGDGSISFLPEIAID